MQASMNIPFFVRLCNELLTEKAIRCLVICKMGIRSTTSSPPAEVSMRRQADDFSIGGLGMGCISEADLAVNGQMYAEWLAGLGQLSTALAVARGLPSRFRRDAIRRVLIGHVAASLVTNVGQATLCRLFRFIGLAERYGLGEVEAMDLRQRVCARIREEARDPA